MTDIRTALQSIEDRLADCRRELEALNSTDLLAAERDVSIAITTVRSARLHAAGTQRFMARDTARP